MTTVVLHNYLEQVNQLLDESRFEEAVSHCYHILQQCPRHIDTYRLLAKALLEEGRHGEAIDLFQRVLSADPNDRIAHVALSILYRQEAMMSQAIWHMERAFEIDPYNTAIQDELRTLYEQSNLAVPTRLPLTQGALARLYFQGELYQLAMRELRQVLNQDSDRIDLEALLAETLWRDDQRIDAVEVCLSVLEKLPNCIQANAILAEIWLLTGRTEEAKQYFQRLQALTQVDAAHCDSETAVGRAFSANGAPSLPNAVVVSYRDGQAERSPAGSVPEWMGETSSRGAAYEDVVLDKEEAVYDWLEDIAVEEGGLPTDRAAVDLAEEVEVSQVESDWFMDHAPTTYEVKGSEAGASNWLSDAGAAAESDVDDFDFKFEAQDESAVSDEGTLEEQPDWLADFSEDEFEPVQIDPRLASAWLNTMGEDVGSSIEDDVTKADFEPFQGEPPTTSEWLREIDEEVSLPLEDITTDEEWLAILARETQGEEEDVGEEALQLSEFSEFALGDVETDSGSEIQDWLLGTTLAEPEELEEVVISDSDERKNRRQEDEPEDVSGDAPDDLDEAMGWLEELAAHQEASSTEVDVTGDLEAAADDFISDEEDLPDWLQAELLSTSGESDAFSTGSLPDWLQSPSLGVLADSDATTNEAREEPLPLEEMLEGEYPADFADLDSGSSWLDRIAAGEGPAIEEPPTQVDLSLALDDDEALWSDAPEMEREKARASDDLSWLDQLGTGDLPTVEEQPTWEWSGDEAEEDKMSQDWLAQLAEPTDMAWPRVEETLDEEAVKDDSDELQVLDASGQDFETSRDDVPEDLDDAMAWLEELAARQDTPLEELPTIANVLESEVESDTGLESEFDIAATRPDEAEPEITAEMEMLTFVTAEIDDAGEAEEPDDGMSWLAELAATDVGPEDMSGIADILEPEVAAELGLDLSVMSEPEEATEPDIAPVPEMVEADDAEPIELDEAITWLEELAAQQEAPLGGALSRVEAAEEIEDEFALETAWTEPEVVTEAPVAEQADMGEAPEDLDDAMAWLEALAARQGAPLDELPSLGSATEPEHEDEFDTLPAEPVAAAAEAAAAEAAAAEAGAEVVGSTDVVDEALEDLDDAMAWLEELVAKEGVPLEEAPSLVDVDEPEVVAEAETEAIMAVPAKVADEDELEETLDWLEQLAVADGVSLEDVPLDSAIVAETPDDDLEEALDWLEQQLAAEEEAPPVIVESTEAKVEVAAEDVLEPDITATIEEEAMLDFAAQMPDDPDAMLAWLEQLAAEETQAVEEAVLVDDEVVAAELAVQPEMVDVVVVPTEEQVMVTAAEVGTAGEADTAAEAGLEMDFLTEMPEDPDAVMAWLERLAARQGAPLAELPSLTGDEEEVATLEPVAEETAMVEAEVDRGEMAAEASGELEELPGLALVDTVPDEIALGLDEELGEATLEWMAFDVEEQDQSDWLEALPESDIASWLAAEEEATVSGTGPLPPLVFEQTLVESGTRLPLAPEPAVEVEAGTTTEPMINPEAEPEPEREADTLILPRTERATSVFVLDKDRLATARQALTTYDYDTAMSAYQSLIETGQALGSLIVELETATDQYPQQPLLRRLLGDAYMRNGQLQKALDTYRQALDQM